MQVECKMCKLEKYTTSRYHTHRHLIPKSLYAVTRLTMGPILSELRGERHTANISFRTGLTSARKDL